MKVGKVIKSAITACLLTAISFDAFANGGFTVRHYGVQEASVSSESSDPSRGIISDLAGVVTSQNSRENSQPEQRQQPQQQAKAVRNNAESSLWMTSASELNAQYHKEVEKILAASNRRTQQNKQVVQQYNNANVVAKPVSYRMPSAVIGSASSSKYDQLISYMANKYNVSFGLIKAVMHTESAFNPNARSPVGAQGLMQLMPATARRFNVSNSYDPIQNVEGGVKYLSWLTKRFNGDLRLALAAYNAGEGNVDKYGGIPPFKETQQYVQKVIGRYYSLYREF